MITVSEWIHRSMVDVMTVSDGVDVITVSEWVDVMTVSK